MRKTEKDKEKSITGLPTIRRHIGKFLTSEEAKISAKGLVTSAVVMVSMGLAAETALAAHTSGHNNWPHNSHGNHSNGPVYTGHANYAPHMSSATHESQALAHTSAAPQHSNTASHASVGLGVPHSNAHTNAALSELVTVGTLHNDATAGFGKHSAGTTHHNKSTECRGWRSLKHSPARQRHIRSPLKYGASRQRLPAHERGLHAYK